MFSTSFSDLFKVQNQYQKLMKNISKIKDPKKKVTELTNATKYLIQNKSDYWLITAHLLKELLDKDSYKHINGNVTKKEYCKKHLGIRYNIAQKYISIAKGYKKLGLKEEDVIELGLTRTNILMNDKSLSRKTFSKDTINKLKSMTKEQILKITAYDYLVRHWKRATKKQKGDFLNYAKKNTDSKTTKNKGRKRKK